MKMRYSAGQLPVPSSTPYAQFNSGAADLWASPTIAEVSEPDSKIDWKAYWRSINKRRWLILAFVGVVTLLAVVYGQMVTPIYRSTATLLIESGKAKILSIEEVYNGVSQDREYYQTQVEILRSRDVALRTVIETKLWDEPEFDPRKPVRSFQGRIKDFFSPPPKSPPWTPERLADATVGQFLGGVSIEPVRLSQLVKISFDAKDKDLAAKVAEATATSFIESDRDARLKLNLSVTGLLQDQLSALRNKLLQSEQELQKYRETEGIVSVNGSEGVAGQQLTDIGQRLVAARVRRTELESSYQQVIRSGGGDDAAIVNQPALIEARTRVSIAALKVEEVSSSLGERNEHVIEARNALAAAQRQLQAQTRALVASMKGEVDAARATERSLEGALAAARSNVQGVNRQGFQLGVLEREVQTNKQLYDLFLSRAKETSVSTNLQAAVARVVDSASPATAPLRPNKPQIILSALLASLALGSIGAIVKDNLKTSVEGLDDAEQRLQHPVLATLPEVRSSEAGGLTRSFVDNPHSRHAEGIRAARTSMLLSRFEVAHKLILVTSALSGEGKTTFCANLAFAHAQSKRTLLIDCDLRGPQIGARLGLPSDAKGIADLVFGNADLKDCVHAVPGSPLLVMPAGDLPEQTEEFLLSPRFRDALKSLASRVDIVLIDSPPLAAYSDALFISQLVNDTIFVVKARETSQALARKGLERLHRVGASVMGLVLTNMEIPSWTLRRQYGTPGFEDTQGPMENTIFGS